MFCIRCMCGLVLDDPLEVYVSEVYDDTVVTIESYQCEHCGSEYEVERGGRVQWDVHPYIECVDIDRDRLAELGLRIPPEFKDK